MVPVGNYDEDHTTMKVLIVDDSKLIRTALVRMLNGLAAMVPITVLCAGTLADGLSLAIGEQPALIVLDFRLPDGHAPQIIRDLKQCVPHIVVAVFTLSPREWYEAPCHKAGADWFFDKASDAHQLLDLIVRHAKLYAHTPPHTGPSP